MYIKQIIIQGFKSYKEQTEIERFSPGLNVIVGRNGSGKSNFFAAIRFVLSDAYVNMTREERQALLHEGSGSAVMSAFVEIIFDNSDDRFHTGKPEVVLRRTIGHKKDEYSLDRKNSSRSDVMNLLESAGFSRSNPYYIVPQGRVTALTNMKDYERLNLLKDVAGTKVYESRRAESLKSMQNAEAMRSKIDLLLENVDERLGQLEEEKEELRKYQEKDRESKCLQYTIWNRTQTDLQNQIAQIEESRSSGMDQSEENRAYIDALDQEIAELDRQIALTNSNERIQAQEKRTLAEDRAQAQRKKADLELQVQRSLDGQSEAQRAKAKHEQDLARVQGDISAREQELTTVIPKCDKAKAKQDEIEQMLSIATESEKNLREKERRSHRFKTKAERDAELKAQIDTLNSQTSTRKAMHMSSNENITRLRQQVQSAQKKHDQLVQQMDHVPEQREAMNAQVEQAKANHEQLLDKQSELRRTENRLRTALDDIKQKYHEAEKKVAKSTENSLWKGIKTVRRLKEENVIQGIHGTLCELIERADAPSQVIDTVAGTALLRVIVDNDDTATQLVEIMIREKGGRVPFWPLNRVQAREVNLPPNSADAVSVISKLSYDEMYDKPIRSVFGRTVICPDLKIGAPFATSHKVNVVTPEGHEADAGGAMTGGYVDPKDSRFNALRREISAWNELKDHEEKCRNITRELASMEQQITKARSEEKRLIHQRGMLANSFDPLERQVRDAYAEITEARQSLEKKEAEEKKLRGEIHKDGDKLVNLQTEMAEPFKKALTNAEEQRLQSLTSEIQSLQTQFGKAMQTYGELADRKDTLEGDLNMNLRPKLQSLRNQVHSDVGGSSQLKESQRELKRATKLVQDLQLKVNEGEAKLEELQEQLMSLEQEKVEKQQQRSDLQRKIEKQRQILENGLRQKADMTKTLADTAKKIRDIGVLPDEAFRKYAKMETSKAFDRLAKVNKDLKQYKSVNKNAVEQYNNFTKQRADLRKRREELDSSQDSIQSLIDHLDRKKDEAIERTFRQVSKEFASVFEVLVPAGKGRLIIQRKSDKNTQNLDEESGDEQNAVENYSGVGISVSFNSKHDEQQRIQQLSGGQKSLCALALVFAIQRCDPAPFYLFDEIDANLDAQYRTAVAQMLKSLSEATEGGGQFICTTFRPEMLLVAEKCYGVSFLNKTSSVDVVNRDTAMDFVDSTQAVR